MLLMRTIAATITDAAGPPGPGGRRFRRLGLPWLCGPVPVTRLAGALGGGGIRMGDDLPVDGACESPRLGNKAYGLAGRPA